MRRLVQLSMWAPVKRDRFLSLILDTVLDVDCSATVVTLKSGIFNIHVLEGERLQFDQFHVVVYFNSLTVLLATMICLFFYIARRRIERRFKLWWSQIEVGDRSNFLEIATDRNGVHNPVALVISPFCVILYVSDARYLPVDEDLGLDGVQDISKK